MTIITITPRLYETDALGHINNVALAAWFETGRVAYLESLLGGESSLHWVLATMSMDFLAETFYGQEVAVAVVANKLGNSSLHLTCSIESQSQTKVKATAVLVYVGANKQKAAIPTTIRQQVQAELDGLNGCTGQPGM